MTTVSRTSTVAKSSVTGGGDWDHRLNRLLEDLQGSVVPEQTPSGTEYREYRMTSSTRNNDDSPVKTEEKWVEYGSRGGHPNYHSHVRDHAHNTITSTSSTSRTCDRVGSTPIKTYGVDPGLRMDSSRDHNTRIEYFTPANTTTVMKSGGSSAAGPPVCTSTSLMPSSSPKVERKEFYAKASYTTLIKGGGADGVGPITSQDVHDRTIDRFEQFPPLQTTSTEHTHDHYYPPPPILSSSKTSSETRREYSRTTERRESPARVLEPMDPPPYTSTPMHQSSTYSSTRATRLEENGLRSPTPPPVDPLKTPPLIRKMMQQSETNYRKEVRTTDREPITYEIQPKTPTTQYYTSTTTRTETREREGASPMRTFPTQQSHKPSQDGQPPKRLDELLATFGESYTETSKISGDGGGPWKSTPYGPGTQPIRAVRLEDNTQMRSTTVDETRLTQRKAPQSLQVDSSRSPAAGPVALYPPGPVFRGEEEALMERGQGDKGKAKMKMDRKYKAGEKSKSSHSERGGQGAAPVPVCLPICCAAPCVIM